MANAPDSSSYVLMNNDTANLPNNRQLASTAGIQIGDTGPGGFAVIAPDEFLASLQGLSTNGFVARTTTDTAAIRTLTTDGTLTITNPGGVAGNPLLVVTPRSSVQNVVVAVNGTDRATQGRINFIPVGSVGITAVNNGAANRVDVTITGSAAPSDATFIIQTPNSGLSNEQALSLLSTGIMKNTTGTGVISIATPNTDYQVGNANLTAISAITPSQGGLLTVSGGGAIIQRTIGTANQVPVSNGTDWAWGTVPETGAPSDATYWTSSTNAGLSAEVNLGALTTGLLKHTVVGATSTPATAVAGTDYYAPAQATVNPSTMLENGTKIFWGNGTGNLTNLGGSAELVCVGYQALLNATGGNNGTFVGSKAGTAVTGNAGGTVAVGQLSAGTQTSYINGTFVGTAADATAPALTNMGAFGAGATVSQSDMISLGNGARVCINRADPDTLANRPYGLQLGNDVADVDPQIYLESSAVPNVANITANDGVFSVLNSVPKFSTSAGNYNLLSTAAAVQISEGGTGETTASAAFDALSPMTTAGDLISGGVDGAAARIAVGSNGDFLSVVAGAPAWASTLAIANGGTGQTTATTAFDALSPMTTEGDLIVAGAAGTGTRLPLGIANTMLFSTGTAVAWYGAPAVYRATFSTITDNNTAAVFLNYTPDAALLALLTQGGSPVGTFYVSVPITGTTTSTATVIQFNGGAGSAQTVATINATNPDLTGITGACLVNDINDPLNTLFNIAILTTTSANITSYPDTLYVTYYPTAIL